jgi:hypothetical protein
MREFRAAGGWVRPVRAIVEPYWIYGVQGVEDGAVVNPARVGHDFHEIKK